MATFWIRPNPESEAHDHVDCVRVELSPIVAPAAEAMIAANAYADGPAGSTPSDEWVRLIDTTATGANVHILRNLLFVLLETRGSIEGHWSADLIEQDQALERELRRILAGQPRSHHLHAVG